MMKKMTTKASVGDDSCQREEDLSEPGLSLSSPTLTTAETSILGYGRSPFSSFLGLSQIKPLPFTKAEFKVEKKLRSQQKQTNAMIHRVLKKSFE